MHWVMKGIQVVITICPVMSMNLLNVLQVCSCWKRRLSNSRFSGSLIQAWINHQLTSLWLLGLKSFVFQISVHHIWSNLNGCSFSSVIKKLWLLFWNIAWINRINKENGSKPHKVLHYAVKQHLYFPLDLCHYIKYNGRYQPTFKYNKVKITAVSVFRNLFISGFFSRQTVSYKSKHMFV